MRWQMLVGACSLSCAAWALGGQDLPVPGVAPARVWQAPDLGWVLRTTEGAGSVQVLDVRQGIKPLAVLRSQGRPAVLDVRVDSRTRQVWLRSEAGVDLHDAYSGRLLGHWKDAGQTPFDQRLVLEGQGRPAGM
jgi:hypothetical protein